MSVRGFAALVQAFVYLCRLCPPDFRRQFGSDMAATFADQSRLAYRRRGRLGLLSYCTVNFFSVLRVASSERLRNPGIRHSPSGPANGPSHGPKGDGWMSAMLQDVRYAIRDMVKEPGFTALAVLTLALGIGANTAIFSIVHGVLLNPLPYHDPDRIVAYFNSYLPEPEYSNPMSANEAYEIKQRNDVLEVFAAYSTWTASLTGSGEPVRVDAAWVMEGFFDVFGVEAAHGRTFVGEEDVPGQDAAVILSHGMWQSHFGSDPGIVNRDVVIDGRTRTVVGIMKPDFDFPRGTRMWMPRALNPTQLTQASVLRHSMGGVARLRPGTSLEQSQAESTAIMQSLADTYPDHIGEWDGAKLVPLQSSVVGGVGTRLYALLGAVGFLLLIGCANVANLLLARGEVRHREIALRAALGADRGRIFRQLLTESTMLAAIAGGIGVVVAVVGFESLLAFLPGQMPRTGEIAISLPVLGFGLGLAALTGVVFGLIPAWQASSSTPHDALKDGGRAGSARKWNAYRGGLVVVEVALVLVLMFAAGLMTKSFWKMTLVDPGLDPDNVLTFEIAPSGAAFATAAARAVFYDDLYERLGALPGVEKVGAVSWLPYGPMISNWHVEIEGREYAHRQEAPLFDYIHIDADYFAAIGKPVTRGRAWNGDDPEAPSHALINETAARSFWPEGGAVGSRLKMSDDVVWRTVIGVVADNKNRGLAADPAPELYLPRVRAAATSPWGTSQMQLVLRTVGEPTAIVNAVRDEVWSTHPDLPVANVAPMTEVMAGVFASTRFTMGLLVMFAALGVILGSVGIYGVVSYTVAQRMREFGIRMALGATTPDVLRQVLRHGMRWVFAGVVLGLVAAYWATRAMMSTLLFETDASDPLIFGGVVALLVLVALVANCVPAWRAGRADPVASLRP